MRAFRGGAETDWLPDWLTDPRACHRTRSCRSPRASKVCLEAADRSEPFAGHLGAVGNAAGQAGARGLVPHSEAHELGGPPYVVFAEAAFQ